MTPPRKSYRKPLIVAIAAVLGIGALWTFTSSDSPVVRARQRAEIRAALRSDDPEERKNAAWELAEEPDGFAESYIAGGLMGGEASPDVRESYAYCLGQLRKPENLPAIRFALEHDESGYVRAAAWLAVARIAPDEFRALIPESTSEDDWDRLGIAMGRIFLGDASSVDVVLHLAAEGTWDQRAVACRMLAMRLRPLLDCVGRWPIEAEGTGPWDPAVVREIERRCEGVDLAAVYQRLSEQLERTHDVRREIGRIHGAQRRIAKLLFGG